MTWNLRSCFIIHVIHHVNPYRLVINPESESNSIVIVTDISIYFQEVENSSESSAPVLCSKPSASLSDVLESPSKLCGNGSITITGNL